MNHLEQLGDILRTAQTLEHDTELPENYRALALETLLRNFDFAWTLMWVSDGERIH